MNVLFIDPTTLEGKTSEAGSTRIATPNMGLISLGTYLKAKTGSRISILDMAAEKVGFSDIATVLTNSKPNLVGISAKTYNILSAYRIASTIKEVSPETIVMTGGAHPTALPEQTLRECTAIDVVILREGESTVLDLHNRIESGCGSLDELFADLPGTVYRNEHQEIIRNVERELISDLDFLPFPDFSLVDYDKYRRVYNPTRYRFQHVYPVFASRGCPFNCTFCMPLHTRKHRIRSIDNILDEIERLNRTLGAERIYFEDSLFCSKIDWFMQFCDKYTQRGLHKKVQWGFETRIDTASAEMFKMAKRAGCIYTFFGVESGNETVLRRANKGYTKDLIIDTVMSAKQAGIDEVNASIVLGLPFETRKSIEETLKLVEHLPCDTININILDVYPETAVFKMADRGEGGLRWVNGKRMNWSAYSRLEPMVEVNDISSDDLLEAFKRGLIITARKARKDWKALNLKRLIYAIEFARTDRGRLIKNVWDTIRGLK